MNELKRRKTENGNDYVLIGDYYIQDLKLPEENCPIGKFAGKARYDYRTDESCRGCHRGNESERSDGVGAKMQ